MKTARVEDVKKIAVLRANGLGDFCFAQPALEALRAAYPEAEIVYLGLPWHVSFLFGRPSPVDRIIPVPVAQGIREESGAAEDAAETERFLSSMREERFDIAVQMHGGGRFSNPFILKTNPRLAIGLRSADACALHRSVPYIYFQPEIMRYLEVVNLIGAMPVTFEPRITVTATDVEESFAAVRDQSAPIVALVPGAGDGRRRWPADKFAQLGDLLARQGARIVVPGIGSEREAIRSVIRSMKAEATDLCDSLSVGGLAGLLSRCALIVANDSGALNLAIAVGTPTVGIYWCGNLITAGNMTRAIHRPVLSWTLECPACGTHCIRSECNHHDSFVADVRVDEVYSQAADLLS